MMRHEVVERRQWLTNNEFLDMLAASHLIPGPNSTEMAIHLGLKRGRGWGLLTAGLCFIVPASIMVGVLAWGYTKYGSTPQVSWLMYGIGPVIVAIIAHAVWKLGRTAITGPLQLALGVTVALLSVTGVNELVLLGGGAVVACVARLTWGPALTGILAAGAVASTVVQAMATTAPTVPVTLTRLTLFFVKVGSILFGSGYVLLAFLRADLTERWEWLTEAQLIDAITIGQITPGPVFTTATFIGYLLMGWPGALLATVGIFAPGFVFVAITQPLIPKLRASRLASGLLDGVVLASLGLMAAVTWQLGPATIVDLPTTIVALVSLVALVGWSPNATWLILGGAVVGWLSRGGG